MMAENQDYLWLNDPSEIPKDKKYHANVKLIDFHSMWSRGIKPDEPFLAKDPVHQKEYAEWLKARAQK